MLYAILRNVLEERAERSSALDLKSVWQQLREKAASGSGQESPDGRSPMSLRGITSATSPGQVRERLDRRPDGEREVFFRTRVSNLLVEFECFSGQVSAHVEQYQVIHIGLPQKSRCLKTVGLMDLDAMSPQDRRARLARRPTTVDEENGLARKNRLATKRWWAIHTPPPERGAQLGRILLPEEEGVKGNRKGK